MLRKYGNSKNPWSQSRRRKIEILRFEGLPEQRGFKPGESGGAMGHSGANRQERRGDMRGKRWVEAGQTYRQTTGRCFTLSAVDAASVIFAIVLSRVVSPNPLQVKKFRPNPTQPNTNCHWLTLSLYYSFWSVSGTCQIGHKIKFNCLVQPNVI